MKEAQAEQAIHGLDGFTLHDSETKVIRTATIVKNQKRGLNLPQEE